MRGEAERQVPLMTLTTPERRVPQDPIALRPTRHPLVAFASPSPFRNDAAHESAGRVSQSRGYPGRWSVRGDWGQSGARRG
jgi:hypothetical protein